MIKRRKLAHELLFLTGICAVLAAILFHVLSGIATAILESYIFQNELVLTEFQWMDADNWIFRASLLVAVGFFVVLFLVLLGDRLNYIRKLTQGIDDLTHNPEAQPLPLSGNNELTELAQAINDFSDARRKIRQQELALAQEKDQLIRTLSHDIRTPLTSILSYSDFYVQQESPDAQQMQAHFLLIGQKARQIRDLTDVLLEGSRRNPEVFQDAHLLMEQLAAEFEESLEDIFTVSTDLSCCPKFSGTFDVQQLRRIFDNLSSNVQKYADPSQPVSLYIGLENSTLQIRQKNTVRPKDAAADSYKLGLSSIRRIAQDYEGQVQIAEDADTFSITVTLSKF